jgi:iron complex outermembrane receptor protein
MPVTTAGCLAKGPWCRIDANGNAHLPTDYNEGEPDNKMSRRQQMVGYSFSHQFDDTFTVRQNLRYAQNNVSQNSVYG